MPSGGDEESVAFTHMEAGLQDLIRDIRYIDENLSDGLKPNKKARNWAKPWPGPGAPEPGGTT